MDHGHRAGAIGVLLTALPGAARYSGGTFPGARDELAALLYALVLEPEMRHKIGLAKPVGLGSVRIEARELTLILDWFPNVDHLPIYVAREQGLFAEENLDIKIISFHLE